MNQTLPIDRSPKADATLSLLWERIRRRGDMPGFTRAINAILASMRGEDERDFSMTQTVLSDPVLTQKVLRLANSGMYSAFGQHINTVSKAVLVLGTEAIGHLALGLKLIEELSKSTPDSLQAHIEMEKAVLAGMVAQQVAARAEVRDPEEAVVCSILHSLGRMMVTFYLPERWTLLQEAAGGGAVDHAAFEQLGLTLEQVGRATAEHWGLPRNLIAGMRRVEPGERGDSFGHDDWLAALGTMSSQCAESLWHGDEEALEQVAQLASSFAPMLGIEPDSLVGAIEQAKIEAAADLSIAPLANPPEKRARAALASRMRDAGNKILIGGVAEMRSAAASASPGQMMSMAIESAYHGLSFTRAFGFLRSRRDGKYSAKIGLGDGAKSLQPNLVFDDAYEPNVFFAALGSDRVIFIENARDPKFASKLPGWWKGSLGAARCFVIIPLCTHGEPVGFIYGDWDDRFPSVYLSQTEFSLLNDMRALVVKSVEKRQQLEAVASRA
ncbi:histidine kinase [Massilia sp. WF1]|uniref:HDOD domain-containing protein n=1 Tax=unclassified Massilia TaxID=2609279 RepID=UPI00064B0E64|nr:MULTISPECIES: HDOD domain-containing protein [unclassified Massilia]ALK97161.1 histidine kinase [Massilia sp. WG5]KLU35891.1 histidine kinase [Massilia sp. WF1]